MTTITISNLSPTGSELFDDYESYLKDLTDDELGTTNGGLSPASVSSYFCIGAVAYGVGYAWGRWGRR
jgi:lactobin A/cerein 7B family class IIb bacteriocin